MIQFYGADSVRWFILSDSPPEKDVQWSDTGVAASNKYLQKIWNLVNVIIHREEKKLDKIEEKKILDLIEGLSIKIDNTISTFKFNVTIAHFYEAYKVIQNSINSNVSNKCLLDCMMQLMKLMLPITPHLSNEVLELLNCKNANKWPEFRRDINENVKMAIQINGKTRDIISVNKDLTQEEISVIINGNKKIKKFMSTGKLFKTIFVKNRIVNYIIK